MDQYSRTRLLLGDDAMDKLKNARVAVFGESDPYPLGEYQSHFS